MRVIAGAAIMLWLGATSTAATSDVPMEQAYARAARLLDGNLATSILNPAVVPHWIGDGKSFWYRRDTRTGPEFWIVETATGQRRPAFDAVRVEKHSNSNPDSSWSPDQGVGVFAKEYNLWLRRVGSAQPVQLTTDGVAHFAYGGYSPYSSLFAIPEDATEPYPPPGLTWAPDGRRFVVTRYDERAIKSYPIIEWVPRDGSFRPKNWELRIPMMGDAERSLQEVSFFDVVSGKKAIAALPEGWSFLHPGFHWSADGRYAYGVAQTRWAKRLALTETNIETGKVRLVIDEPAAHHAPTNAFVDSPANVRILEHSREALWFSERDGWGQIYLYDLVSGRLKRQLTSGPRTVRDLIAVDERGRRLYFTANGTDQSVDPYHTKLYSVSLDGGRQLLLTPEEAVHVASRAPIGNGAQGSAATAALSPDGKWLVESYSSVDQPPVNTLRAAVDGRVIATFERADVAAVDAAGWRKPMRVRTIAADGITPLWGTIYFPRDTQPGRKYPVIDATYGGPQAINAPADYVNAVVTANPPSRASLAELGFIVVTIDGRGTPGRSEAFSAFSYENFADPELADHIAGIKQLAARFGNFDLDRVGVYGHSFGGYVSARAILTHGDFYKVAVSSAGLQSFQNFYPIEELFAIPDYGRGRTAAPEPDAVPVNFRNLDNMHFAGDLKGKLLLVYGDLDENVPPGSMLQLIDALIKANKPYDLLYLPNRTHEFFRTDAYYTQRMWDYFVRNLLGETPPANFTLTLPP